MMVRQPAMVLLMLSNRTYCDDVQRFFKPDLYLHSTLFRVIKTADLYPLFSCVDPDFTQAVNIQVSRILLNQLIFQCKADTAVNRF